MIYQQASEYSSVNKEYWQGTQGGSRFQRCESRQKKIVIGKHTHFARQRQQPRRHIMQKGYLHATTKEVRFSKTFTY